MDPPRRDGGLKKPILGAMVRGHEITKVFLNGFNDQKLEEETISEDEQADMEDEGDDIDCFFESLDRVPSNVSLDVEQHSSGSESDEDDARISFASAIDAPRFSICVSDLDDCFHDEYYGANAFGYDFWMTDPVSLNERRRSLFLGMGLRSRKDISRRDLKSASYRFPPSLPPSVNVKPVSPALATSLSPSKLDNHFRSFSNLHKPFQTSSAAKFFRSCSFPSFPRFATNTRKKCKAYVAKVGNKKGHNTVELDWCEVDDPAYKIKNLDTGKEFVVSEVGKDGTCGGLNDIQTGLQLTMDQFERFLGLSPIIKELMSRVNTDGDKNGERSIISVHQDLSKKSSKSGPKKRGNWLKNIKFVANSVTSLLSEKERCPGVTDTASVSSDCRPDGNLTLKGNSTNRLKVHQHRKSYKELTGLYKCQEIQAHHGSIWCMKFSSDGRFLASAGDDKIVHVWQVKESETFSTLSSLRRQESRLVADMLATVNTPSSFPMQQATILGSHASKRARKENKLGSRKHSLPEYITFPDTIFSISESPVCSFEGHHDDVLDLSWSKSQLLLSSSMDKTVRLWDMESKACLKLFAHNDYVTCIHFNPMNEDFFISGSLDGKIRIWNIPNRQVIDWSDLHEMVTAVCYTPDGQGVSVGSHKGSFRFYNTIDDKLSQENQADICIKKKRSNAKKITGFQYAPDNCSEVIVTSADSQIRVFDGADVIHKFKGFQNTSSQISASFTSDGKYIICPSEDSNVYMWKHDTSWRANGVGKSKGWVTTRSCEYFYCKDVSVAIPWPNAGSTYEKPSFPLQSCRNIEETKTDFCHDDLPLNRCSNLPPLPPKVSMEQKPLINPTEQNAPSYGLWSLSHSLMSSVNSSSPSFASKGWGAGSSRVAARNLESRDAWGLVIVTAGLGGKIRAYQNFGLPVRLSRQSNLF